ncbi:DUF3025 domain-containing protein [Oceanisphaera avium]|uniref:DUF3025 domain-containing protein n=1 Tax=Oceanisphaera avium TaxID=1903694 RepID=A0A1Y0CV68_9GAMM|nr:DUF3025 domain-containing protein [Oceanisphaera avium]ART79233.1 hypothetical protein CBP12_02970 [Oceanisphaera avium]
MTKESLQWDANISSRNPILAQLAGLMNLSWSQWPSISQLNERFNPAISGAELTVRFIDDAEFLALNCYYEQAVAQAKVPTRYANWHDFFGAIIWFLFPQTKSLLTRLHMEDINAHGLKRTPRRDRITHFDECGLVLAVVNKEEAQTLLQHHQWHSLFIEQRARFGQDWQPFIFGHALYEQALTPFIGLTAKCIVIEVEADFFLLSRTEQYAQLDPLLADNIDHSALFDTPRPLLPLPLLGIPGWWPANEDATFYDNQDYFRPARNR